jgi:hypothetical protein
LLLLHIARRVNGVLLRVLVVVVLAACLAAPLSAQTTYGGIGATISHFNAQNPHDSGTPPVGAAYYRIDDPRWGRAVQYHVELNPQSKLSTAALERLMTVGELPADAKQIKGWKHGVGSGYCAVYKSRWLGRVLYGPYVVIYVSASDQSTAASVSTAPFCRG